MYTDLTPFNVTILTINSTDNSTDEPFFVDTSNLYEPTYNLTEIIIFGTISSILSLVTVTGNCMVMISITIDKQLQTISNFFLFSLAVADFAIGLISMPLFTISTLLGYWPLGPLICDTWLALDYLASNASVLNLLIISFDRYFSVMRPLTYRVSRTNKKAKTMIGIAWGISLVLWPPWIYSWPYIEGKRTVPDNQCYIQFIETNHYITFITAIAAFYAPVTVMCFLYWRIWQETEKRQKDLPNLQAGKKDSSRRSNSSYSRVYSVFVCSDEATNANSAAATTGIDFDERRRARSESSMAESDLIYMPPHRRKKHSIIKEQGWRGKVYGLREWCITWWYSGKDEASDTEDDSPSEYVPGYITPLSVDTPIPSTFSRCTSLNVIRDPQTTRETGLISSNSPVRYTPRRGRYNHLDGRKDSKENVYTILIKLPENTKHGQGQEVPSITMIPDPLEDHFGDDLEEIVEDNVRMKSELNSNSISYVQNTLNRRPSTMPDNRIPLNAKGIPKPKNLLINNNKNQDKKKKKPPEKKADRKAAKTLSAILLAFIITWTPYNILVLLKSLTGTSTKMPPQLWDFFYYLCYINSTVNPVCYALTNTTFRRTYWRIFRCKWSNKNRAGVNRGFHNT